MADQQTRATGARPVGPAPRRRPWWLWLVLAVIVIALLVFGLVRCGASGGSGQETTGASVAPSAPAAPVGGSAGASTAPSAGTAPSTGTAPSAGASAAPGNGAGAGNAAAGTLTAGGTALLPLAGASGPNGELKALVGRPVTGRAVTVQSVPSDEGFWIGTSETDRVWVALTVPAGESPYQVLPGQTVDLGGTVTAHDAGFAQQQGVDPAEGAEQLTREAAHVAVLKADLRILQS